MGWSGWDTGKSMGILFFSTLSIVVSLSDRMASISMSIRMALNPNLPVGFEGVCHYAKHYPHSPPPWKLCIASILLAIILKALCVFSIYQCVILIYILCSFKVIQGT